FLDDFRKELTGLATVVLPQKFPHFVHGDVPLEIEVQVFEQIADQLLHEGPPRPRPIESRPCRYTRAVNAGASQLRPWSTFSAKISPAFLQNAVVRVVADEAWPRVLPESDAAAVPEVSWVRVDPLAARKWQISAAATDRTAGMANRTVAF